jgi:hypothetical protein
MGGGGDNVFNLVLRGERSKKGRKTDRKKDKRNLR